MDYIKEHLQLALAQVTAEKEQSISEQDFVDAAIFRDVADMLRKAIAKLPPPVVWTEGQVAALKESQKDQTHHPYTCGNDSNHRPLIPTKRGWVCNDCDYRQNWSHETGKPIYDPDNEGNESKDY